MKCERHPDTDAVGACVSCGRGICPICKISYNNMLHCKECIEAGRIGGQGFFGQSSGYAGQTGQPGYTGQTGAPGYGTAQGGYQPAAGYGYPYYPYYQYYPSGYGAPRVQQLEPKPTGTPSKNLFNLGSVGCVGGGITAIITGLLVSMALTENDSIYALPMLASSFVYMVFTLLYSVGLFGFYRNYGSGWGLFGAIGVITCVLVFFPSIVMSVEQATTYEFEDYINPDWVWIYTAHLLLGIGTILSTVAVHQNKGYLDTKRQVQGLINWASIGLMVSGILFIAVVGIYMVGWIILAISLFLLAVEFHYAPVPGQRASGDKAKDEFFPQPWDGDGEREKVPGTGTPSGTEEIFTIEPITEDRPGGPGGTGGPGGPGAG